LWDGGCWSGSRVCCCKGESTKSKDRKAARSIGRYLARAAALARKNEREALARKAAAEALARKLEYEQIKIADER